MYYAIFYYNDKSVAVMDDDDIVSSLTDVGAQVKVYWDAAQPDLDAKIIAKGDGKF